MPRPHMSCPDCGAAIARDAVEAHSCDEKRELDYRLLQLRTEIEAFEDQLSAWLATTRGRFETWLAARDRQAGPDGFAA
ncbi:MAG TPA: hypothetical protein VFO03_00040 [Gaiellaceae bacterium]|nr:hypothetical protein [Gaiellaceae bacterium]